MNPIRYLLPAHSPQWVAIGAAALTVALQAQPLTGHYPAGAEGIKGASLPPPGLYLRDYNIVYFADRFKNGPPSFDLTACVNAPRLIWMTDCTVLGANYGLDLIVPVAYTSVKAPGLNESTVGLADIQFEPLLLAWHWKQFDLGAGYAFWAPTGDFDPAHPSRAGKGFWSNMLTLGGTWYPTADKAWALSVLNRYEIHTENTDLHITPGDTYTVEWGLSRSLSKTIDAGVIGYYQAQVFNDRGPGVAAIGYNPSSHPRVVALGPEISAFCPLLKLFASVRYVREFAAAYRPEGNEVTVTLTRRF